MVRLGAYIFATALIGAFAAACAPTTTIVETHSSAIEVRPSTTIREDARIKLEMSGRILETQADMLQHVNVDVYEGTVLLTGAVDDSKKKQELVELAGVVDGVKDVIDEVQVEAEKEKAQIEQIARDVSIESRIKMKLYQDDKVNAENMVWRSVNGTVYLFGRALSPEEQANAISTIHRVDGVEKVVNRQQVRPAKG